MGTAEIYNALTHCEVLSDALVVEANSQLILFAVAKEKREETKKEIRNCVNPIVRPDIYPMQSIGLIKSPTRLAEKNGIARKKNHGGQMLWTLSQSAP